MAAPRNDSCPVRDEWRLALDRIITRANGTKALRITAVQLAREVGACPPNRRPDRAATAAAVYRLRDMLHLGPPEGWASVEESWDSRYAIVLRR